MPEEPQSTQHRRAVELRLSGLTLQEVSSKVGLSPPTVAKLTKRVQAQGWQTLDPVSRKIKLGRPRGGSATARQLAPELRKALLAQPWPDQGLFDLHWLAAWLSQQTGEKADVRAAQRRLADWQLFTNPTSEISAERLSELKKHCLAGRRSLVIAGYANGLLYARGPKGEFYWLPLAQAPSDADYEEFAWRIANHFPRKGFLLAIDIPSLQYTPRLQAAQVQSTGCFQVLPLHTSCNKEILPKRAEMNKKITPLSETLTHLQRLEAESIHIMREVVAESENPVMLYSIGKDSAVMLRLAVKAFYPAKIPFPLLHVDTTWKFQDMYRFRERMQKEHDFELLVHTNEEGLAQGINPFTHGSQIHTDIMKTVALKQALDKYGFDAAFGGARRDEEKSRAKERVFSFRTQAHRWDPKNQRPELWNLYNARKHKGESIRVFPISNWTELDIWQYIYLEDIPIVPLYFSAKRPVVERGGTLIMVDDDRMPLNKGEVPMMKSVRFRTLGCYPLTGAVESKADTLEDIIQEMLLTTTSERQGRMIDHDSAASMEKKKQEGYF